MSTLAYTGLCTPVSPIPVQPVTLPTTDAAEEAIPESASLSPLAAAAQPLVSEEGEAAKGNGTEDNVDFDFVNLPGYGVVDDANTTANASQFSCYHRRYGYYADVAKNCLMFHLCYPVQEPTSQQILFQRFTFVCSDNAIFDQQHLVCVDNETLSTRCEDSSDYFGPSNDKLIASLHQSAQGYVRPKADDEAGEEVATESTISEAVVPAEERVSHDESGASGAVEEVDAAQYGALLESLFG